MENIQKGIIERERKMKFKFGKIMPPLRFGIFREIQQTLLINKSMPNHSRRFHINRRASNTNAHLESRRAPYHCIETLPYVRLALSSQHVSIREILREKPPRNPRIGFSTSVSYHSRPSPGATRPLAERPPPLSSSSWFVSSNDARH